MKKFEITIDKALSLMTAKQLEALKNKAIKQLIKDDKTNLNDNFKSLFNVFNYVKTNSIEFSNELKKSKCKASDLLGTLSLNQFLTLCSNGAKYTINTMVDLSLNYCIKDFYEREIITLRGTELNALIIEFKNDNANKLELINDALKFYKKEDLKKLSKTNAKFILECDKELFFAYKLEDKFSELVPA